MIELLAGGHEGEGDLLAQLAQGSFAALPVGVSAEAGADLGAQGLGVGEIGFEQRAVDVEGERIKPHIGLFLDPGFVGFQFGNKSLKCFGCGE